MKKNRSIWILCLLIMLLAALLIGGTLSYFTDEDEAVNKLVMGDIEVDIDEPEWNPEDGDGEDMTPGEITEKDPLITAGKGKMYMRLVMQVEEIDSEGKRGAVITDKDRLDLIMQTLYLDSGYPDAVTLSKDRTYTLEDLAELTREGKIFPVTNPALFREDTSKNTAGVYYYDYIANDGIFTYESEQVKDSVYFMSHIIVPAEWGVEELELLGGYHIVFKVQAIQSEGFDNIDEALAVLHTEWEKREATSGQND